MFCRIGEPGVEAPTGGTNSSFFSKAIKNNTEIVSRSNRAVRHVILNGHAVPQNHLLLFFLLPVDNVSVRNITGFTSLPLFVKI